MLEKDKMIEYLNIVLDSNISNPDSYIRWCRGFGPELDLKEKLENVFGFEHLPTGWFLYYGAGENFCTYCTISTQKITDKKIKDIYNKISQYTKKLYYIEYSFNRKDYQFREYNVKDKKVLILGGGGVVPSIICALQKMNVSKIVISNRTKEKANSLKALFKDLEIVEWGKYPYFDIIINATSLGLNNEEINLDFSNIGNDKLFYDVIYNPSETNFLKEGKKLGNKVENGKARV